MIYKFICTDGLGIATRQNEMIEMALTFGFRGIEIDMADMLGRAGAMGIPFATQFINSAAVEPTTFRLPIDLRLADAAFEKELAGLDKVVELCKAIKSRQCYLPVYSTHPSLAYRENFEKHQQRIKAIADKLEPAGVRCGLLFQPSRSAEGDMQFLQKPEDLVALVKMIQRKNIGFVLDTWTWQLTGGTVEGIRKIDLASVSEIRLADPKPGVKLDCNERNCRQEPGTHPDSLAIAAFNLLKDNGYKGPVAVNGHVESKPGNAGDLLFQRIGKSLDRIIDGTIGQETDSDRQDESVAETVSV